MFNTVLEYFKLALRSLVRRKLRSWLTMIGIFIGIAAVVSLIGLGDGLTNAISSQFGFLGPDVLQIQASGMNMMGPPGTTSPRPLTSDLAKKIDSVNGVDVAINRYIATGTLEFNNLQGIGFAMSIPDGEKRKKVEEMVNIKVSSGRLLKDGDSRKVILGSSFGDNTVGLNKPVKVGDRILLNNIPFEVLGIMEKKGSFIFDMAVIVNEDVLLKDLRKNGDDTVNIIAVKIKDANQIDKVKSDIEKVLRKERGVDIGEEDFVVQSAKKTLDSLNSSLFAVKLFVIIIASISLLVGGIGIMNTMYTAVLERTKEIGIMKSIGATNKTIFSLFALESGLLGMVGGIIGVLLGLFFAFSLASIGKLALGSDLISVKITPFLLFGSLAFSFFVGLFAGLLPAVRASKMKPVDSLRFVK